MGSNPAGCTNQSKFVKNAKINLVNKFTVDFFIFHILRVVTRKILFDCCLALLDLAACVTHAPRLWRGRILPGVPFFLPFSGYLSSKSDIRIFLPILSYSIKFIPFQTENATFLPHQKKLKKFAVY